MAKFYQAIHVVIKHEGGFSNHPSDKGGPTNYGISLRFLKQKGIREDSDFNNDGIVDLEDVHLVDLDLAVEIYKKHFWDKYHYKDIKSQKVANKVFDLSVNMGPRRAHILLQWALRSCGQILIIDGIVGPITLDALHHCDEEILLASYRSEAAGFYRRIARGDNKKFLTGWLNRAYA